MNATPWARIAGPILAMIVGCALVTLPTADQADQNASSFIVQATDTATAARLVRDTGGAISHELKIINAVAAELTPSQLSILREADGISTIYGNSTLTVAVLDTGWDNFGAMSYDTAGNWRVLKSYDAIRDSIVDLPWRGPFYYPAQWGENDSNGHASHITSIILSRGNTNLDDPAAGLYHGIAPDANLVVVKALDTQGEGTYADVIRGIDWIVTNKDAHNIRVINCSLSAPARSRYKDDPLNQAVMRAWQAGIVVVASAGNNGPDPMTIGVPGNVPYIITVGAISDNYTTKDVTKGKDLFDAKSDDFLASFSAPGPTFDGFVKPDLVAPGGHMRGLIGYTQLAIDHPEFYDDQHHFTMSGTSQAAAVVSGVVALLLQSDPTSTPDEVKYRLMASAHRAEDPAGGLGYSVLQQGSGLVDAYDAVHTAASGFANGGLDIAKDLDGTEEYAGPVRQNADGSFYVHGLPAEYDWNGSYAQGEAVQWSDAVLWSDGLTETMAINAWVPQE